jgi:integrase/recombinase XerD
LIRSRPAGLTAQAPFLRPDKIKRVVRLLKSRPRFSARAEVAFHLSFYLGLRAKEIASLRWGDVFGYEGRVRDVLHLKAAYTKGSRTRDVFLSSAKRLIQPRRVLCMDPQESHVRPTAIAFYSFTELGYILPT